MGTVKSNAARQMLGEIAPKLAELSVKVLFGDVWEHAPRSWPRARQNKWAPISRVRWAMVLPKRNSLR